LELRPAISGSTCVQNARFKKEIRPIDKTSEAILALKPVSFQYKSDTKGTPQFGLIAEEVAKVSPDLVVRDRNGEIYSVRYEAVNAMLLNEFLKEHRKVQEQEKTIIELKSTLAQQQKESQSIATQQQKEIQALAATLEEQASQIQKVSAQLLKSAGQRHKQPSTTSRSFIGRLCQTPRELMKGNKHMKTTTTIIYPAFAVFTLAWFALSPTAQAVVPPPDGGYPNGNTAEGTNALFSLANGVWNTALGFEALNHDTAGGKNTATGLRALFSDTTGSFNTATGVYALYSNTMGWYNSAIGANALSNNITGQFNTATGYGALNHNKTDANTANGFGAMFVNTTGSENVAVGFQALNRNSTGSENNAVGSNALFANRTGSFNNAHGRDALATNVDGSENNAFGDLAMENNTSGASNTAIGDDALRNCVDGSFNVAIGDEAGTSIVSASNIIAIGAPGAGPFADISSTCFIGSIYNQPVSDAGTAQDTYVDQFNVLGFLPSSRRVKHDIQPMDKASEAILALKPVTFKYNSDKAGRTQYGVIAEEVAEVAPDLVFRDNNGDVSTVRFEQIGMMLLNEFLKEHKKVEEQQATITELKSTVARQQKESQSIAAQQQKEIRALAATVKEQASQIQKVSAQLELQKAAPRAVANYQ
jgi:septal ring factor EnvC (AmiA/AmiB activator)